MKKQLINMMCTEKFNKKHNSLKVLDVYETINWKNPGIHFIFKKYNY